MCAFKCGETRYYKRGTCGSECGQIMEALGGGEYSSVPAALPSEARDDGRSDGTIEIVEDRILRNGKEY